MAELLAVWQEREAARELLRADPGSSNLRKNLKAAGKRLKSVRFEAVQRFFEEFISQVEVRIKDGDQAGFHKHLKGMDLEGRRLCSVQHIKDEKGRQIRDMGPIRGQWVQWFSTLINTMSPALDLNIVEELKVLRSLRWRKRSRPCRTGRLLDPMSFRPNCSVSS